MELALKMDTLTESLSNMYANLNVKLGKCQKS